MVNKEFKQNPRKQERKSSLPVEIPQSNFINGNVNGLRTRRSTLNESDILPFRKISHPISIKNGAKDYCNFKDDSSDSDDDNNEEFIMFDASNGESPSSFGIKDYRNMMNRRKATVIANPRMYTYLDSVKKKKSSSGVSSSSDDNNFMHHSSFNEISGFVVDKRRCSDNSLEEISSNSSSPAVSRRSSQRRISDNQSNRNNTKEDSSYGRKPNLSSAYHANLTKQLTGKDGKTSTSSRIGLFEKISSDQKSNSRKSIYEFRARKKQEHCENENLTNQKEDSKTRAKSVQEVTNLVAKPDVYRRHKSINERFAPTIFSKKKSFPDPMINETGHKRRNASIIASNDPNKTIIETSESQYDDDQTSFTLYSRSSSTNNFEDDRKRSFVELQEMFATNQPVQSRKRISTTDQGNSTNDQSTQTENRLLYHFLVNNPQNELLLQHQKEQQTEPQQQQQQKSLPKSRRFSLPPQFKYDCRKTSENQPTEYSRSSSHQSYLYRPFMETFKKTSSYRDSKYDETFSNLDEESENIFVAQIKREKMESPPSNIDVRLEDDLEATESSLRFPWQNQCLLASPVNKNKRRFSLNQPILQKEPLRRNKSLETSGLEVPAQPFQRKTSSRKTSLSAIQNCPWGDKRLSVDVPIFFQENVIDENANEGSNDMDNETNEDIDSDGSCNTDSDCSNNDIESSFSDEDNEISDLNDMNFPLFSRQKAHSIREALSNAPWYAETFDEEGPATPEVRTLALSMSSDSLEDRCEQDSSVSNSFEDHCKVSVIQRPKISDIMKMETENQRLNNNLDNKLLFHTLKDLKKEKLAELGLHPRTESMSSVDSEIYFREGKSRVEFKCEVLANPPLTRQRKYGITHLTSLENVPKRRRSVYHGDLNEWQASLEDDSPLYGCKISSAFGTSPYLALDQDIEIVSDQSTLDVIKDSYNALNMDSDETPNSFEDSALSPMYRNGVFINRSLDNVDEEQEIQPVAQPVAQSPPSFESASWFLERKKKEMLRNVNSPVQEKKGFFDNENDESSTPATDGKPSNNVSHYTCYSTMFGYFNHFLYAFITKEHTTEKWKEITKSLRLTKEQRHMFENPKHGTFDDNITHKVLQKASTVLNINFKLFINKYGVKYYDYCSEKYGDILKSIATNLTDFINNMDDIRRHIHKIEKLTDCPTSIHASLDTKGELLMYYQPGDGKPYLTIFLMGFIKRAAWVQYGMRCRISVTYESSGPHDHSIISIKSIASLIKKPTFSKLPMSSRCKDMVLEPDLMDRILPFHILLNEKLEITQLGDSLNQTLENYIPKHGLDVRTYFKLDAPIISFTYESIRRNLNTSFIVSMHQKFTGRTDTVGVVLKGQITYLQSSKSLWFIGSPKVDYMNHLNGESNLFLSDIPLHDVTREVLLVGEQKHSVEALKNQLQIMTNRLKETSKELAIGKINTENILDQMFPKDVADKLMRDLPVPAVTTETVTILFTDIVGFTAICEQCDPEEVTVMLNKLYIAFDYLCEAFEIYKVETIGDAYMAVGGLHHSTYDHGRRVTAMGVEMVRHAENVSVPRSKESLQIRVGIHSGSVVAGVVGTLMPRYCLFGKNVTLANKMESTSLSGKVHISPYTYLQIKHYQEFIFSQRSRDVMPSLMDLTDPKIKYVNSFFVNRHQDTHMIPSGSCNPKVKPYMMQVRQFDTRSRSRLALSRKDSFTDNTESVVSESYNTYPEDLRITMEALDQLNGKGMMLLRN